MRKQMELFIERKQATEKINFSGTVEKLLKKLQINPETVLVIRNNEVMTEEEKVKNADKIDILSVISGG